MLPQLFQMCFTIGFSKDLKSQRLSSVIIGSSPAGWLSKTLNGSTLCAEWIFVNRVFTQTVIFSMFCFLAYLVLLYACSLLYRLVCPCLKTLMILQCTWMFSLLENSLAPQWAHSGLAAVTRWIWFGFLIFQHESALVFDPNISKHWKDGCRDRGDIGGGGKGETTDWFVNSKAKGNSRCFRCPKESTARADCSNSLLLCLAANKNSIYMIKLDLFL